LQRFRGFLAAEVLPDQHVAVVGEPRAGRTDLLTGLRRALDPASTTARLDPLDVHRPLPVLEDGEERPLTEVEVTLVDLGSALEQDLDGRLELLDPATGLPAEASQADTAVHGLRLCYRLRYDEASGTGSHWVDYPRWSEPAYDSWVRATRAERALLPFVVLDRAAPLQLRAEGRLRALLNERDAKGLEAVLIDLREEVAAATDRLSATLPVRAGVREVLNTGPALLLQMSNPNPEDQVGFQAEDGSTAALLRAVQPALKLDAAGVLPLRSHGSTTAGILAAAEAAAAATDPEAVVLADDFGDDLDASAAEYLAAVLRRSAGQVWLSTRRPEVVRAFRAEELLRLTRHDGRRRHHQLQPPTDRKARAARRQLLPQLLAAMSAETVALLEGPHDLEGYTALADRRLRRSNKPPPAAYGVRLIAPAGADGGKDKLPVLARLAGELGFRVRVAVDGDAPNVDAALLTELQTVAETVVRLPDRTAVERALVAGLPDGSVTSALQDLSDAFGLGLSLAGLDTAALRKLAIEKIKTKPGLHQAWVDLLPRNSLPPLAVKLLEVLCAAPTAAGTLVQLADR
jgi:hypothetical protein